MPAMPDQTEIGPAEPAQSAERGGRHGVTRRGFLSISGAAAVGVIGLVACDPSTPSGPVSFPENSLAKLGDLAVGKAVRATYPDDQSPVLVLKMGRRVEDGVGPDGDIVAYSALCAHMGCEVSYRKDRDAIDCPCHFSSFDPAKGGMQVIGQATTNLPQVVLEVRGDNVVGVGMRGLLYGRQTNLQKLTS